MNKTIPILGIVVLVVVSFMVIVYFEPELFGLTRPHVRIGEYDGTASKMVLMINEQCLDQKENSFKDYAFTRTSNGEYYIDNVICERINVHQGGCLEPFSKRYPDETCKNRITFDFPYGETGPEISKEFCNQVESERSPDDSEHNIIMVDEYVSICTIRDLIDDVLKSQEKDLTLDLTSHPGFEKNILFKQKQLQDVLEHCERQSLGLDVNLPYLQYENETHLITHDTCEWKKMHIRGNSGD